MVNNNAPKSKNKNSQLDKRLKICKIYFLTKISKFERLHMYILILKEHKIFYSLMLSNHYIMLFTTFSTGLHSQRASHDKK